MDGFRERYGRELDSLTLGPDSEKRLVAAMERACADSPARGRLRRGRHRRPLLKVAAVILVLVLGGGAAYGWATGEIGGAMDLVERVFPGAPASVEVVDGVGRVLGSEASSSGVTVRAEAVLGDGHNVVVILSLMRDGGWGDLAPQGVDDKLPLAFEGGGQLAVDGVSTVAGGSFFFDDDTGDDVIRYVLSATTDGSSDGSICGHEARVALRDLSAVGPDGVRETVSPGRWTLRFPIDYENMEVGFPAGGSVVLQRGATATGEEAVVSPVGVAVTFSGGEGRVLPEDCRMSLSVTLSDGTVVKPISTPILESADGSAPGVLVAGVFDRLIDPEEVDSVNVGAVSIDRAGVD